MNTQTLTHTVGLNSRALSYAAYACYGTEQLVINQLKSHLSSRLQADLPNQVTTKELCHVLALRHRPMPPHPQRSIKGSGSQNFCDFQENSDDTAIDERTTR